MEHIVQQVTVLIIPIIFAITLHEAAHGYVARHFGDATAYLQGRVSLNPVRHIDPFGTVILPLGMLILSSATGGGAFLFGWAKPVPVNFGNLRNPKRDMLWVALAGPAMNLLMALLWAAFFKAQLALGMTEPFFQDVADAGIKINLVIMLLNLVPILPLDGGRIVVSLLPPRLAWRFSQLEPYGMVILLVLLFSTVLANVLTPFIAISYYAIRMLFNF